VRARVRQTQPVDTAAPHTSASSIAVRSTGTCWNTNRYTARARRFGPYTTGPVAAAGAAAVVTVPHAQRRLCIRCSVVDTLTSGISMTWRTTTPASAAVARSRPHPRHESGT